LSEVVSDEVLEYFTPSAKQVLILAREEALLFHHNFVGTEQLLLGILRASRGVALNVLKRLNPDLETARKKVTDLVGPGPGDAVPNLVPFTPRVMKVLRLAAKEAKALGHFYIGTEHILLALLSEDTCMAGRVLQGMKVDPQRIREEIMTEHGK
jgi:ATP-dependent Clp protease ATP-binding subunit ClpC